MSFSKMILGSRSPRRRELLSQVISESAIEVVPPLNTEEAGFEQLHDLKSIGERLISICMTKNQDVVQQIKARENAAVPILTADTIVVVEREGVGYVVLGQPPAGLEWKQTVRNWFLDDYAGRHTAY